MTSKGRVTAFRRAAKAVPTGLGSRLMAWTSSRSARTIMYPKTIRKSSSSLVHFVPLPLRPMRAVVAVASHVLRSARARLCGTELADSDGLAWVDYRESQRNQRIPMNANAMMYPMQARSESVSCPVQGD